VNGKRKIKKESMKYFFLIFTFLLINAQALDFTKDIKPIFDERCAKCHGEKKQKSDFRLDNRQSILAGGDLGEPGAHPGQPDKSTIIKLISLDADHDDIMPPKGDPLSKKQISLISQWIKEGAKMPETKNVKEETLWSYQAVTKPSVPNYTKSKNVLDAFLNKKLAEKGLAFSSAVEPITLLRRVQTVLTGILPSADEIRVFLAAWKIDSNKAYESKVDELLKSKHFGERWAQHWLDSIRWSETNGSESNEYRQYAWQYRDYVIGAFNTDKPYKEFIIDQLAGDMTGEPRATGFLVAGPHVPAATIGQEAEAVKQARYDRLDQIMQTLGASMMGTTLGCARCHSHKFDPIKINDYYSILANFQGVEFDIRKPELSEGSAEYSESKKLFEKVTSLRMQQTEKIWLEKWNGHSEVHMPKTKMKGFRLTFNNNKVNIDEMELFDLNGVNILRGVIAKTGMTGEKTKVDRLTDGTWGWGGFRGVNGKPVITFNLDKVHTVSHFTISSDRLGPNITDYLKGWKGPVFNNNMKIEVLGENGKWQLLSNNSKKITLSKNHPLQASVDKFLAKGRKYEFIGKFIDPVKTNVLLRGSPSNLGVEVEPGALTAVISSLNMSSKTPDKERRMKFARWLASKENPLTARVMVNRLWHHTFGTGIVSTLSDFGNAGAKPSHPELLDFLAAEFVERSWSTKSIIKQLVMSEAFRQSSRPNAAALEIDANARLLWRFPPRRAEAEVIRDSILKLSASLDTDLGGIGYRIHNVKQKYALWQVTDNYSAKTWRRMIYQERMRGVDDRMFTAFDFPDCGQVLSKRPSSTTPLQALNLMNSEFINIQCDILAKKFYSSNKKESVTQVFQTIYNRAPTPGELAVSLSVLETEGLKVLCRALLNSNEFVFIQ
jgi:hypothetical protein